jgi:D-glycero-alpha-D-manno-heptose-7-phosphate kinase
MGMRRVIHLRAPLRVSFVGGGTDFPDYFMRESGQVIVSTIDSFVYVTLKERPLPGICVHNMDTETVFLASQLSHTYARVALEYFGILSNIEIIILPDTISIGSGLGASSALMSALVLGLSHLCGHPITSWDEIARVTLELENRAGTIGGCQDQFATSYGGFNVIRFEAEEVEVEPLPLTPEIRATLEECILLVFTHRERNAQLIQSEVTRSLQSGASDGLMAQMYGLSSVFRAELASGTANVTRLGRLIDAAWQIKKRFNPFVTNSRIDELYEFALANGATGGKMSGAGGGGFFLLVTHDAQAKQALASQLNPTYACMDVKFHPRGVEILWKSF